MDIGRILDGTPEPPSIIVDFLLNGEASQLNQNGDYVLPVPMTEFQRQLCDEVVSLHYSDILRFYAKPDEPEPNTVMNDSLHVLFKNSQLVATHPFLVIDHYMPSNLLLKTVPAQLCKHSGKFKTLIQMLDLLGKSRKHIALVSRGDKRQCDIIEAVMLGRNNLNFKRYTGSCLRNNGGGGKGNKKYSTVHLFSSDKGSDTPSEDGLMFDFVIAMDSSFDSNLDHIVKLRNLGRSTPAPIIRLIPHYSAEHIAYKYNSMLQNIVNGDDQIYIHHVVAATVILRGRVGTIPIDLRPYYAQGLKFLEPWITNNENAPWPIPSLPEISDYSAQDVEFSLLTEISVPEIENNANGNDSVADKKGDEKGNETNTSPVEIDDDDLQYYKNRRFRREVYSPEVPETALSFLALPAGSSLDDGQVLTHKILRLLENAIQELGKKTAELESLQLHYKNRDNDDTPYYKNVLLKEASELEEKIKIYERKTERHNKETLELQTKQAENREEIDKLRADLLNSADYKTPEELHEKILDLTEQVKKVESLNSSKITENEYMRVEYQKANAAKADSLKEIEKLAGENVQLRRSFEERVTEFKAKSFEIERKSLDDRIIELEKMLADEENNLKETIESEKVVQPRTSRRRKSPVNDM